MPLPNDDAKLAAWLRFDDWLGFSPDHSTSLIVRARGGVEQGGKYPHPGWMHEPYEINCGLVDPAKVDESLDHFDSRSLSHPSWEDERVFDFGETLLRGTTRLAPFVVEFPKLGAHGPVADVRQDFTLYHQLRRTAEGNYRHPLDDLLVVEIRPYGDDRAEAPAEISINLDYLKDYLAARESALLWNLTMDRFAARATRETFRLEPHPETRLRPGITRRIDLDERNESWGRGWVGRGTLFLTTAVLPYDAPKGRRNPWSISYLRREESTVPFVVDAAGTRRPFNEMHPRPMVLYFRRQVLAHYLSTPGHKAFFVTRRWGRTVNARGQGVDMGINGQGLITAFTKDIGDLPVEEQALWSAHSVGVNGEVCEDWMQTRMMNNPPATKNVVELVDEKREALNVALRAITGQGGFGEARPGEQKLGAITIGPLTDDPPAFSELALTLCQLAIDPLKDDILRGAFPPGAAPALNVRSLGLLEQLLVARCGIDESEAKRIVQPLRTLNWLRQEAAHVGVDAFGRAIGELGFAVRPDRLWEAWDALVDRTASALAEVASRLRASIETPTTSA